MDDNVIFSRVAQMPCTRRKNTWHHVVDLSCFSDVLDVSSCCSETPSLIEEFRGRVSKIDVDFRDVCHVLRVLFYVAFCFSSSVSHVSLYKWVRIRLRQCVRCVFTKSLAPSHVCCCVAVGAPGCSTWLHIALRNVFRVPGLFSSQHLGKSRVAVCFPVFNCRNSMRDRPLCRTLWSVESLIARELRSRLCVAVMFTGAYYVFRDFAFLLLVVVSVIFVRCSNSV